MSKRQSVLQQVLNNTTQRADKHDTRDKLQMQADVLHEYLKCGMITVAARRAKINVHWVYQWRRDDIMFRERWNQAQLQVGELIEDEAKRRAVEGYDETVYDEAGNVVAKKHKYSDTIMVQLLKGNLPDKYRDRDGGGEGGQQPLLILPSNGREINLPTPAQIADEAVTGAGSAISVGAQPRTEGTLLDNLLAERSAQQRFKEEEEAEFADEIDEPEE
jgi:hypothetical protein